MMMSYEQNDMFFFFMDTVAMLKIDDSVLDSAYDWLALSPPHHSDNLM